MVNKLKFRLCGMRLDAAFNDQFVNSATVNGVERWEKSWESKPKGTDTLDARKFRILSRLNEQLPYTLPVLKSMLQSLCGEDGYSVEVQNELYTLKGENCFGCQVKLLMMLMFFAEGCSLPI